MKFKEKSKKEKFQIIFVGSIVNIFLLLGMFVPTGKETIWYKIDDEKALTFKNNLTQTLIL